MQVSFRETSFGNIDRAKSQDCLMSLSWGELNHQQTVFSLLPAPQRPTTNNPDPNLQILSVFRGYLGTST